jgi:hypothetical protein
MMLSTPGYYYWNMELPKCVEMGIHVADLINNQDM